MQAIQQAVKFSIKMLQSTNMPEYVADQLNCVARPLFSEVMIEYKQDGHVIGRDTMTAIDLLQAVLIDVSTDDSCATVLPLRTMDERFMQMDGLAYATSSNPLTAFTSGIVAALIKAKPEQVVQFAEFSTDRVMQLGRRLLRDKDTIRDDAMFRVERLAGRDILPRNAKNTFAHVSQVVGSFAPLGSLESGANQAIAHCGEFADVSMSNIYENSADMDIRGELGPYLSQTAFHEYLHAIDLAPESRYGLFRGITSIKPGMQHIWLEEAVVTLLSAEAINCVESRGVQQSLPQSHTQAVDLLKLIMQASENEVNLQLCGEAMFSARSSSAAARTKLETEVVKTFDVLYPVLAYELDPVNSYRLPRNGYEYLNVLIAKQRSRMDVNRTLGKFASEGRAQLHLI